MYHLFMGSCYYPLGGMRDYAGTYDTIEDAKRFVSDNIRRGWHRDYEFSGSDWAMIATMENGKLTWKLEYGWVGDGENFYGKEDYLVWREVQ